MEETNKDPNFMAQADTDKKLEEKFKAANQKLEEIQKVGRVGFAVAGLLSGGIINLLEDDRRNELGVQFWRTWCSSVFDDT